MTTEARRHGGYTEKIPFEKNKGNPPQRAFGCKSKNHGVKTEKIWAKRIITYQRSE
jgi:hypothetical protein